MPAGSFFLALEIDWSPATGHPVAVFYGALAPAGGKTSSMVKHTSKSLTNETAKKQGSESKASKKNLNYSSK